MLDPLYKRTSTGAIQVWEIETEAHRGRYRTISGQLNGKQVVSEWTQAKPKNTGRSNATTAQEQCMLEAKAAWEKKQRDGYSLTADSAHGSETFQCMLAKNYDDPKRKKEALLAADWKDLWSQTKLDGVRLIARKASMMSRKNREIVAVPHVAATLEPIFEKYPDLILDGELYNHEFKDDFDSLVSLVRKGKPTAEDFVAAEVLQYHVYDCAGSMAHLPYSERARFLEGLIESVRLHNKPSPLQFVPAVLVPSEKHIDDVYAVYLNMGYEGQMLRIDAPYENKRSDKLLKRKEFQDEEFVVQAIEEGDGNRSGQAGYVVLGRANHAQFKAGIKAPLETRIDLLENAVKYVGGVVTIRFNGRTPSGIPRFPRAVAFYPEGRDV